MKAFAQKIKKIKINQANSSVEVYKTKSEEDTCDETCKKGCEEHKKV